MVDIVPFERQEGLNFFWRHGVYQLPFASILKSLQLCIFTKTRTACHSELCLIQSSVVVAFAPFVPRTMTCSERPTVLLGWVVQFCRQSPRNEGFGLEDNLADTILNQSPSVELQISQKHKSCQLMSSKWKFVNIRSLHHHHQHWVCSNNCELIDLRLYY